MVKPTTTGLIEEQILQMVGAVGAILKGDHFEYASGDHGDAYVNKDVIFQYPKLRSTLCYEMARRFLSCATPIDTVLGPVVGGALLAQSLGYHINESRLSPVLPHKVLCAYADKKAAKEKGPDEFVIQRGYDKIVTGKRVLIVEDILNSGGSVKAVVKAVRDIGGTVVGVCALCNRGDVKASDVDLSDTEHIFFSLMNVTMQKWKPDACPLCKAGIPINTKIGHGAKK